jgi:Predicted membrane protein (DUF2157)
MAEEQVGPGPAGVTVLVERWVASGLITREQAERIYAEEYLRPPERPPTPEVTVTTVVAKPAPGPPPRVSLVTEALGYLGGVLILVATVVITARYWDELPLAIRLGLAAAAAALLLAAGLAVPERLGEAGRRLRAVMWLASTGAFAGFLALIAVEVFDWDDADVALFTAGGIAVYAGTLWAYRRNGLQQMAVFGALVATAASAAGHLEGAEETAPGLAVWGVGLVWLTLAWGGLLAPRQVAYVLGSIGAVFGAQATMGTGWGHVLALATIAGLVGAAVLIGNLVVLSIGAVGTLMILPETMEYYFPGALAAPLALLAAGVLLVVAALRTTRPRREPSRRFGREFATGNPVVAVRIAGVIAVGVTATVLVIGL